jgi:glycosyltransferase involved in cell wall biosynthesis
VYLIKNRDVQVWFQGDEHCEAYKKMLGRKYEDKLFILNAVLRDLPLISDADQNNKTVDLLYIGRITMEKGIKDLLNAISILHSQGLSPKTVIVGVGPYLSDAKQLATNLNIDHLVSFAGYVSDSSEICSYFQMSKLFVLPSHTEGLPRSMLESMAACLPVIVTGVGGIPYLIKNNVNGYLVKPENPAMLSDKIREALNASDDELSMIIYRAKSDAMRYTFSERANYFLSNIMKE